MSKSFRNGSKENWSSNSDGLTIEQINAGSLQRIADASEKMAMNHDQLIRSRDYYKRAYESSMASVKSLERSNASLRGQITKMKNAKLAGCVHIASTIKETA
jgi:hypothetical protein